MSFIIGDITADLVLIYWLNVETSLTDLTYGEHSSRVIPAYPQLFCNSVTAALRTRETAFTAKMVD